MEQSARSPSNHVIAMYALENKINVLYLEECNVNEGWVVVHELKYEYLECETVFVLCLCSGILQIC